MPDAALQAYLAKNYLDGAKAEAYLARSGGTGEEKKRKRKKHRDGGKASSSGQGIKLVDDEDDAWRRQADSDEDAIVVADDADGQNAKRTRWSKLRGSREDQAEQAVEGDMPQIANADGTSLGPTAQSMVEQQLQKQQSEASAGPSNSSGGQQGRTPAPATLRAGLKTREEMRAERLDRERKAMEEEEARKRGKVRQTEQEQEADRRQRERDERQEQTVYRDASGRRIDVQKEDEERRRTREEERKREREKRDWNKGQIQLQQLKDARRREEEARDSSFARYANDAQMNAELRQVERQNDPAALFLTKKDKLKGPQKPVYKGPFPPNRFGIRPGYRWDGVERSNGFEAKLFQRRNERTRRKAEMQGECSSLVRLLVYDSPKLKTGLSIRLVAWSQEDM